MYLSKNESNQLGVQCVTEIGEILSENRENIVSSSISLPGYTKSKIYESHLHTNRINDEILLDSDVCIKAKEVIVIVGAGAIGRGFLPWKIDQSKYDLVFVDTNSQIVDGINKNGGYLTFKSHNGELEERFVYASQACLAHHFKATHYGNLAMVFIAVGPNNVEMVADSLRGIDCPIVLCENDPKTVKTLKSCIGSDNVYFAVPDVITSNTASKENLQRDPLAIHTEDGELFVDNRARKIDGDITYISPDKLLTKEWQAKLFLHNTPHCIAAYLGAMHGLKYLHEVMENPNLRKIVVGAMNEMLATLKSQNMGDDAFLDWYTAKEIERFSDKLLCDPIDRVAREPYRKLQLDGRLIGAAALCDSANVNFDNILIGIVGASIYAYNQEWCINLATIKIYTKEKILSVFEKIGLTNSRISGKILKGLHSVMDNQLQYLFIP